MPIRSYRCGVALLIATMVSLFIVYVTMDPAKWYKTTIVNILPDTRSASAKTIQMWTGFFKDEYFGPKISRRQICSTSIGPCVIHEKRDKTSSTADAIVFHGWDFNKQDLPPKRSASSTQIWVLYNFESPVSSPKSAFGLLNKEIDVMVSYRMDSDVYAPYGKLRPRVLKDGNFSVDDFLNEKEFAKKRPVTWLVSNCRTQSNREGFVKQLKAKISVDIYGGCGKRAYFCSSSRRGCYKELSKKYKFYLSFENSLCVDYVTEKFFLALTFGMIPVVMGGANYSRIAPSSSYINALDFDSPALLAEYLNTLNKNFTLYKQYFEWKKDYVISWFKYENVPIERSWACGLCDLLHNKSSQEPESIRSKKRRDIVSWWFTEHPCWPRKPS